MRPHTVTASAHAGAYTVLCYGDRVVFAKHQNGGGGVTVYADVLFLVNFSLDYVSLYITGRLMSRPLYVRRLAAASAFGALYAVSALFWDIPEPLYIAATLAVSGVMCLFAYRRACKGALASAVETAGSALLLFSVGCALGGAMTAIYSLGKGYSAGEPEGGGAGTMTAVTAAAVTVTALAGRVAKKRRGVRHSRVTLTDGGKSVTLDALSDSGNLLFDPTSGRPALIVSADAAADVLPQKIREAALSGDVAGSAAALPPELLTRVRLLPVSNVYGKGLLLGFRPDAVTVERDGSEREYDLIVAVSGKKGGFGGFGAVLPAELS